eukprot:scaffold163739_cov18-Tisochrysis_lutea.AAC.1
MEVELNQLMYVSCFLGPSKGKRSVGMSRCKKLQVGKAWKEARLTVPAVLGASKCLQPSSQQLSADKGAFAGPDGGRGFWAAIVPNACAGAVNGGRHGWEAATVTNVCC